MSTEDAGVRRQVRPGRPARISREQIIAVARSMDPEKLTMQAVARELQVERSAVNYHVRDRDQLLELVANDIFLSELRLLTPPETDDWRDVLRRLARLIRDSIRKMGVLHLYFRIPMAGGAEIIRSVERMLVVLTSAGFAEVEAMYALNLIGQFAFGSARDALMAEKDGVHPQIREIKGALDAVDEVEVPFFRALFEGWGRRADEQFEFSLGVVIAGLERVLESDNGRAAGSAPEPLR